MQAASFRDFTDAFGTAVAHYANVSSARMNQRRIDLAEQGQEFEMALKTRQQEQSEQAQSFKIQTLQREEIRKQQEWDAKFPDMLDELSLEQMQRRNKKLEAVNKFKAMEYGEKGDQSEIGGTLHAPAGGSAAAKAAADTVARTTGTAKPTTGTGSIRTARGDVVLRGGDAAWKEDKQNADEQAKLRAEGREGMRQAALRENQKPDSPLAADYNEAIGPSPAPGKSDYVSREGIGTTWHELALGRQGMREAAIREGTTSSQWGAK